MLRAALRRTVRRFGFDLVRFDAQHSTDLRRLNFIRKHNINVVVDVGASVGEFGNKLRSSGYSRKIVSFEPLSAAYAKLSSRAERDQYWTCRHMALGNTDGQIAINIARNSVSSSVLPMESLHVESAPQSAYVGTETVDIYRLDTLNKDVLPADCRAYLKLDVQGYEREVLMGAQESLTNVRLIECELSLVPLYADQPTICDMISLLSSLGFVPVSLEPVFAAPDGRVLQVDGIFERI